MKTNCDLYRSIIDCSEKHAPRGRSLKDYLLAMLSLGTRIADRETHSISEFHDVLVNSYTETALHFDPAWFDSYETLKKDDDDEGYAGWYSMIVRQIVDLHELCSSGRLEDEHRYFGIDSPRGTRWYNFDPATYLECAAACMFDGRDCIDSSEVNPTEILEAITWDDFKWFLYWGQSYE